MISVNVGFDDCGGVGVEPNERNLGRIVWGSYLCAAARVAQLERLKFLLVQHFCRSRNNKLTSWNPVCWTTGLSGVGRIRRLSARGMFGLRAAVVIYARLEAEKQQVRGNKAEHVVCGGGLSWRL